MQKSPDIRTKRVRKMYNIPHGISIYMKNEQKKKSFVCFFGEK